MSCTIYIVPFVNSNTTIVMGGNDSYDQPPDQLAPSIPKGLSKPKVITLREEGEVVGPKGKEGSSSLQPTLPPSSARHDMGHVVTSSPSGRDPIQFETYEYPRFEGEGFEPGKYGHGALDAVFSLKDYKFNAEIFGQPATEPPVTTAAPHGHVSTVDEQEDRTNNVDFNKDDVGSGEEGIKNDDEEGGNSDGNKNGSGEGGASPLDSGYTMGTTPSTAAPDKYSAGERAKRLVSLSERQRSNIDHTPLFPERLEDYRHTYGNCHSRIKRLSVEERQELGTGIVSPDLFQRVYKRFAPSNNLFGAQTSGSSPSSPSVPLDHDYSSELPIMYSNITVGKGSRTTRLWPQYPDRRTHFPSEHERCHAVMIRQLAILAAVMKKANLTRWFITHATLLGAVRHGGFIPWDADIDVVMPKSHFTYLRKYWRSEFPRDMFLQTERTDRNFLMMNGKEKALRTKDRYSGYFGYDWIGFRRKKRIAVKRFHFGAGIDIIPLEKMKGGLFRIIGNYIQKDDIYPLSEVCFENMMLPAPRNVTKFLERLYGTRWHQVPPQSAEFGGATFLHCVATSPVRGSNWNMNWTHDHPGAPNGSIVYNNYHPFDGVNDVYKTFDNESIYADPQPKLTEYSETIPPTPLGGKKPPGGGQRIAVAEHEQQENPAAEDGGGVGPGAVPTRMAVSKLFPVQRVGKHNTKLFPRSDPHGTTSSDMRTPFMKFVGPNLAPKYPDVPIPVDEKDAEDVLANGDFVGSG